MAAAVNAPMVGSSIGTNHGRHPDAGQWNETPIPQCKGGDVVACWNLVADATCSASGYKVIVNRNGTMPALGTQQSIRCLSCVNPMGCPAM